MGRQVDASNCLPDEHVVTFKDGPCKGNQYIVNKLVSGKQVLKSGLDENGVSVWFQCLYRPGPNPREWWLVSVVAVPADRDFQLSRRYDK